MSKRQSGRSSPTSRSYTQQQKVDAVALVAEIGIIEASKKLGFSQRTMERWCFASKRQAAEPDIHPQVRQPVHEGEQQPLPVSSTSSAPSPVAAQTPQSSSRANRRTAKLYSPSQKGQAIELAAKEGVSAAADELGISRFSIYQWERQTRAAAQGKGVSPTSGPSPAEIETLRDNEILKEWKQQPGLGPSQISNQLRRKGIKVAVNTVRQVMEQAGYRPPKVRREPHDERFEAVRPNQLWHLDFLHRNINRVSAFTLILLDDHSRFVTGFGIDEAERAELVLDTFEQAVTRHGRPERVIHDKGSAFWSWRGISRFTQLLTELGIDQVPAEFKEWNGKLEVFNANLAKELFNVQHFHSLADMRRHMANHLHFYNHYRTSHALGGLLVPADRYYGRTEEVMAQIEAGASKASDIHRIDLQVRPLEVFKVISQGGNIAVWLMGQQLFPTRNDNGNGGHGR